MEFGYQVTNKNPTYKRVTLCSKDLDISNRFILPCPIYARACRFESVVVPNTWRTVDESNNTLIFKKWSPSPEGTLTLNLPVGNYNIQTLITQIQNMLNASSWGTSATVTWTVTHETDLGTKDPRIKIANDKNWTITLLSTSTAGKLCGFVNQTASNDQYYIGNKLAKLNKVSMLNVCSYELGSRLFDNMHSSFGNSSAVVFSCPVQGAFGQIFSYNDTTSHYNFFNQYGQDVEQVSCIDIYLTDEENNQINFQGHDWYVTISFLL